MTTIRNLLVLAVTACAAGTLTEVPADAQRVSFDEIDELDSPFSAFSEPQRMVITDAEAWAEAWQRFHGAVEPMPAIPNVDFTQRMVILAAMGQRSSGGYQIAVEGVYRDADRLIVEVRETSPGPRCVTTAALTSPATAVITDRFDGEVAWVEKTSEAKC